MNTLVAPEFSQRWSAFARFALTSTNDVLKSNLKIRIPGVPNEKSTCEIFTIFHNTIVPESAQVDFS